MLEDGIRCFKDFILIYICFPFTSYSLEGGLIVLSKLAEVFARNSEGSGSDAFYKLEETTNIRTKIENKKRATCWCKLNDRFQGL